MRSTAIAIALSLVALLGAANVAEAACRPESNLRCDEVVDLSRTQVIQTGARTFSINFVFGSGVQFICNGTGGNLPLPPGCPKDGVQFKPDISRNVASATPSPQLCTIFSGTANASGQVDFGFRVRFEQKNAPKRKTCVLRFNLGSGTGRRTATLVTAPSVAPEE